MERPALCCRRSLDCYNASNARPALYTMIVHVPAAAAHSARGAIVS